MMMSFPYTATLLAIESKCFWVERVQFSWKKKVLQRAGERNPNKT